MSRGVSSDFLAAVQASHAAVFPLVQIDFDSGTEYWTVLGHDVEYGDDVYRGMIGVLAIDIITETASSPQGVKITVSGVFEASLSLALQEPMQGRLVRIRLACVDPNGAGLQVDDAVWIGRLDQPQIIDGTESSTIILTAEHRMAAWDRAKPVRYTDAAQQAMFPGDLGLQYIANVSEKTIVWPAAAFFKQ